MGLASIDKPKAEGIVEKPTVETLQQKAPEKARVDAILTKKENGMDGAQITIIDKESIANKTTLNIVKDPAKITAKDIKEAVSEKDAQFAAAELKPVREAPPTKTVEKQVEENGC